MLDIKFAESKGDAELYHKYVIFSLINAIDYCDICSEGAASFQI